MHNQLIMLKRKSFFPSSSFCLSFLCFSGIFFFFLYCRFCFCRLLVYPLNTLPLSFIYDWHWSCPCVFDSLFRHRKEAGFQPDHISPNPPQNHLTIHINTSNRHPRTKATNLVHVTISFARSDAFWTCSRVVQWMLAALMWYFTSSGTMERVFNVHTLCVDAVLNVILLEYKILCNFEYDLF